MTWIEFIIRGFSAFYLAVASVVLINDYIDWAYKTKTTRTRWQRKISTIVYRKPFNCAFCMCFWWAIPLSLPYFDPRIMFGIAGMGAILVYLKMRLEMFVA